MNRSGVVLAAGALTFALTAVAQTLPKDTPRKPKREPTVEEIWREMDTQKNLAEYTCTAKLDSKDPTVEWKKVITEQKDGKWVVTRYGTRNMGMVTGVCHLRISGRKVEAIESWVK